MTRILLAFTALLAIAAAAEAGHRSLFGRVTERVVVRERRVERPLLRPLAGIRGGGCIGTVRGGCAGVTVSAGCGGYAGPAMAAPAVKVVPQPMPGRYWPANPDWTPLKK
jgi:hypothetical protein